MVPARACRRLEAPADDLDALRQPLPDRLGDRMVTLAWPGCRRSASGRNHLRAFLEGRAASGKTVEQIASYLGARA